MLALNSYFINCANLANLSGKWQTGAGGIIGSSGESETKVGNNYIYNSYNIGDIELVNGTTYASSGGIVGYDYGNTIIENCYNVGILSSSRNIGAIVGNGSTNLKNCFYLNNLEKGSGNVIENNATSINELQLKGQEKIDGKDLLDLLNTYVETKDSINDIKLKTWKNAEEYPILER